MNVGGVHCGFERTIALGEKMTCRQVVTIVLIPGKVNEDWVCAQKLVFTLKVGYTHMQASLEQL